MKDAAVEGVVIPLDVAKRAYFAIAANVPVHRQETDEALIALRTAIVPGASS